ncbi:LysM peptidoglycan-binding domain-containing protein [Humisphaera borealis]|uniref:LysM peptidoglycan-binding domain-containing protein n=1 Tax=Humisphaera borealis TaxID=2807512 RepID=A0A7M2WU72_9BACT|nr:LysM peptidoglycan-binding domain-containing protein [Humisphaera borealis]QOV88999.1 LysM peptidoglycan-binding domain-containing protein [Humisphaera borealis]
MTRETKIGLLVGLAFIIVVAILLTDHTATTTDPKPAAQSDIGDSVRQSVTTPQAQIPTRADLDKKRAEPVRPPVVQIGPDSSSPPITIAPDTSRGAGQPPVVVNNGVRGDGRLPDLVARHPDELMAVGGPGQPTPPKPAAPPVVPPKTYIAEAGDSVSRIASRTMGANSKANREALIKANPSLQAEGNPVILGKSYVIPSAGAVAQATEPKPAAPGQTPPGNPAPGRPAPGQPTPPVAAQTGPFRKPPASAPNTYWYTVKENDNLWRIAASELGNGNLWQQIKDLNADVLKGGETVHANQRIRLPRAAGSTASVN